jgi:hypothetical protein
MSYRGSIVNIYMSLILLNNHKFTVADGIAFPENGFNRRVAIGISGCDLMKACTWNSLYWLDPPDWPPWICKS